MAYQTGTATSHTDLLTKLRTFLLAQSWVSDYFVAGDTMVMHSPGTTAADQAYIGAQVYTDAAGDAYGWTLQGFTGYTAGLLFAQPGRIAANPPILPLYNGSFPYWFVANGRRVVVVAKIITVYTCAYLGLIKPYGSPGQYQYPLAIGGCGTGYSGRRWSTGGCDARAFFNPGAIVSSTDHRTSLQMLFGSWYGLRNYYSTSEYYIADRPVWPYSNQVNTTGGLLNYVQAMDGSPVLTPIVVGLTNPAETFGELDGCYHVSSQGVLAEDIATVSGVSHVIIPNLSRSGRAAYMALALE